MIFRVGAQDAAMLGRELAPVFSEKDLIDLPYYHAYIRMMIDGKPAKPFSAKVLEAESLNGNVVEDTNESGVGQATER